MAKKKLIDTPFGDFHICVQCINHPINKGDCGKPIFPDDCDVTDCENYKFDEKILQNK